ncbi:MAG: transposase [Gammaproteobacteria bacterium]|nr:MAG: transposase [Gammaproteobacteria bacterium]QOJ23980.1 MAG: transposase [Gammaproteobacteria bacterium]QOJ24025.1 MAG: transposase [Gammaproteobacteria bacterium]
MLTRVGQNRARFVYRSPHQHEIDKVRVRQETRAFISKMILRKWTIEGLFAEAKQFHGLRRARYRGLQKVSIQALMTAMAQNIKRIVKQSPSIYWLLKKYLSLREEILKVQNYLNYFRRIPKFFPHEAVSA